MPASVSIKISERRAIRIGARAVVNRYALGLFILLAAALPSFAQSVAAPGSDLAKKYAAIQTPL